MRLFHFVLSVFCLALFLSCSGDKSKREPNTHKALDYLRPATMQYSSNDTAEIRSLVSQYIEAFKEREFGMCADLLYKVKNDEIVQLTADEKQTFIKGMSLFPVYDIRESSFVLQSDKNNKIELTIQIVESGDIYKKIGTTTQSLNPVYKNNHWYLTLLDINAEGVENVYEK